MGFSGVLNASQVELGGGVVVAAESDDGAGIQRGGRGEVEAVRGWRGRGAC